MLWLTALTVLNLTVRIYDGTGLPSVTLDRALVTSSGILHHAGIDPQWLDCSEGTQVEACQQPPAPDELVVRIRRASLGASHEVLGEAVVDIEAESGFLATLYANRVARVSNAAHVDAAVVLGRALTHEMGHLLLGHQRHADHGLMRANWSARELREAADVDWQFTDDDIRVIRRQLTRRTGGVPRYHQTAAAVRPFAAPERAVGSATGCDEAGRSRPCPCASGPRPASRPPRSKTAAQPAPASNATRREGVGA